MTCSKRIVYRGRVQGVGFRYTAVRLAESFPVAGYVRNLADGTVEMCVEGSADSVNQFLSAVQGRMGTYIEASSVTDQDPEGMERFQIRY
jgi:acylphosphatase